MVTNGGKSGVSLAAPHELSVWRFVESRASELESLHSIVSDRLDNNFRSQRNKRRRTTGHDNRVAKKKFKRRRIEVGKIGSTDDDSVSKGEKKISRRVRRNIELKKNLPNGFSTSGDGTKRLRTHVWHAKRFTMKKIWGFYVPLGLHGRGRGSRALLKKLKQGVLVHDASYYGLVQLEGPEDTLMSVLSSVLVPSPSASREETSRDILAGVIFGTAMLHRSGKPSLPPIAPVTYLWQRAPTNVEGHSKDVCDGEKNNDGGPITRQLWVWIHAAAFQEAYDALDSACQGQTGTGSLARCISREGQLAKLELMGSKVFQLLQKTLIPASSNSANSLLLKKCSGDENANLSESVKLSVFENGNQISSSAVVSLVVKDPRALSNEEGQIKEETASLPNHEADCVFEFGELWDASKSVKPPMEESVLCMEKHNRHNEFIRLGRKISGPQNASIDREYSRICPVLLLKHEDGEESVTRCSVILPLSWVKAFWITFMSNGAHAIGLREKQWVASEMGLPYFPSDFPDCNAYSNFMAMESDETNHKANLLPPSKRPPQVPIPPPWSCVHLTLEQRSSKTGKSYSHTDNEKIDIEKQRIFEGAIARTSCMLSEFLRNISGENLLLFPKITGQKNCLYKFMRDKEFLEPDNSVMSEVKCAETLCYVRVLLRACKEGAFEQGAVVCAPHAADVMPLTASSESDDQRLQIPQASQKSYFKQLPSGKWELELPEDEEATDKSYRWPIGFITTGFVRGSKKATSVAFCEASLLSSLRREQWKALPLKRRKKEIYVLVRNMRSTAYRLAIATIVLEQHEEDAAFI
ncbi:hypothetical protein ABFX02_14G036000 [Erythranthe guttata]